MPAAGALRVDDRRDDRLEVGGGQDVRQRVDERADRRARRSGRAKSSTRALLARDFSG